MLPERNKKFMLNEGRQISGGVFNYGGFPRILKETEEREESEEALKHRWLQWYEENLKLGKTLHAAQKSRDPEKIKTARNAFIEHKGKMPLRKKPLPSLGSAQFGDNPQTGHGEPGSGVRWTGD